MKRSSTWFALILIALALLLSGDRSAGADTVNPAPRATPQSHRETATEEEPTANQTDQAGSNRQEADALALAAPSRPEKRASTTSAAHDTSEEERHDRREEALEQRLVCLTAILAIIEVITLFIFVGTMIANIRAANAAKTAAEAAQQSTIETQTLVAASIRQAKAAEAQVTNLEKSLAATEKAADAAMKNADAAVAAVASYLYVNPIWLEPQRKGADLMEEGVGHVDPKVHYGFHNYGKSPATVTEFCLERFFGLRLPQPPAYTNIVQTFNFVIVEAEKDLALEHSWNTMFGGYLSEEEMEPVRKMSQRLYIYGYIRYSDFFNRRTIVGFAWRVDAKGAPHFVSPEQAPLYVFRRFEN